MIDKTNSSQPRIEHSMTKQEAIKRLQSLQMHGGEGGSDVHANADIVLCDFLDAIGHGAVAYEFRKIHEMNPTVTPRYARPSWRS